MSGELLSMGGGNALRVYAHDDDSKYLYQIEVVDQRHLLGFVEAANKAIQAALAAKDAELAEVKRERDQLKADPTRRAPSTEWINKHNRALADLTAAQAALQSAEARVGVLEALLDEIATADEAALAAMLQMGLDLPSESAVFSRKIRATLAALATQAQQGEGQPAHAREEER